MRKYDFMKITNSNQTEKPAGNYVLVTLMLTIAIEVMGFGLVFPLFPALFMHGHSVLVDPHTSSTLRYIFYGIALAAWPVGAFFGTPYLGQLSDKFGRKKILLACLILNGISYGVSAVSIYLHSAIIFFLSRLLSGFFGGSYEIAQAATADISPPEKKARNMGWVTLALSVGLIIGPAITALTAQSKHIRWFTLTTPFWIAFSLAMINAVCVTLLFKETHQTKQTARTQLSKFFSSFLFMFTDNRIIRLSMIFLLLNAGWSLYFTGIPLVLSQRFQFSPQFTGLFFCVLGAGCAFSILFIQQRVLNLLSLKNIYIITTIIVGFLLCVAAFFSTLKLLWITAVIFGILEILCYSSLLAMISNAVTVDEQGKVMGGLGAITSISFFIASGLLAWLSFINVLFPLIAAAITYLLSSILMFKFKPNQHSE